MFEFGLLEVPAGIEVIGRFDDSCQLRLSTAAMDAIGRRVLRLKIARIGAAQAISNARIEVLSSSGSIKVLIGANAQQVVLGENTSGTFDLRLWGESSIRIGENTTSNGVRVVCARSYVSIGADCMFSDGILVQAADQHGIVDLRSGRITNDTPRKTVIGNHVWLGRNSTLLPDVSIGKGSVIGAGAVVTKDIPETCIAAGVPARVVRTATTWSRSPTALDAMASQYVADYGDLEALHSSAP